MPERKNWTHAEVVEALSLYCQIPFGQIYARNPAVRALATKLYRTPSAVALKLSNLASLDPTLMARGVGGMKHGAAMDRVVWDEMFGRWDELAAASPLRVEDESPRFGSPSTIGTEVPALRKERRGQAFFRNAVLSSYRGRCCITGIEEPALLRASHIIPWSKSPGERLNPMNGLALNALHDAAFDSGFMTIDESHRVILSSGLKDAVPERIFADFFSRFAGTKISEPERFGPAKENLAYHREHVFQA
jgi:hypothetical protein